MTPTYMSFGPCIGSLHHCYHDRGHWVRALAWASVAVVCGTDGDHTGGQSSTNNKKKTHTPGARDATHLKPPFIPSSHLPSLCLSIIV
jgi:hypothetical protein